ncbi:ATP-dependent DNA helicase RecG [Microlunatus panaciterrae]|uniref:ATP-dependent DNA helicase RecG n=1 Tax=Microlunatus panaciterrae TaxID=400768 RepID=A0ABS2RNV4_9ACTN|nr:ATP-dependent DNA helicase RecG [Microlunatus panaciterrae]MBM7800343.1 ATP-dependent DNA helicase RecG [Microlunatus panaciterrae]
MGRPASGGGWGKNAPRLRIEATITDHRGYLTLAFFGPSGRIDWWEKQLTTGTRGIFAGKVGEFNGKLQLAHPDFVILDEQGQVSGGAKRNLAMANVSQTDSLIGLYPATGKLRTWTIAESAGIALDFLGDLADPLPQWIRAEAGVVELSRAFHDIHRPHDRAAAELGIDRLRFDEAFGMQLTMAYRRADAARHGAVARPRRPGGLLDAFDARLPFTLTRGQQQVSEEIFTELARPVPMQRLLQGEVGSGKTLVALRAMLAVIDAGGQAALLAPTEVLAGQHFQSISALLGDLGQGGLLAGTDESTEITLLTGSMSAAQKRAATLKAASGAAGIVIGTHALLAEHVQFAELGLVVVDEQHRFGVEQRAALSAKAEARPHVLVMTATPIPRSVAMTVFGDLEVSTLRELPAGRAEVSTVVVDARRNPKWVDRGWQRVVEEVRQGRQAYVVCARISSADKPGSKPEENLDEGDAPEPATAVEDLFAELSAGPLSAVRVEMLHGQLAAEEKDAVMRRFSAGETDVIVSTTVIEVGVDVPNASVMVICDADRFGISQLHQLRGRIGRGGHPGVCLLLTRTPDGSLARQRLDAVAATRDGFALADVDLEQRREGDVLGASQSGVRSSLRLLRVLSDADLIAEARVLAERCVQQDPDLRDAGLADTVGQIELQAAGEWLERT